ncbi:DNA-dependent RNA polymerase auxiliary subunit epsilon family protein [Streptococcus gallolyticus]|nr:DNA-dependent RNA polymerase auxiliary subunit epsilon family protein [Streptococcus gallolyticus]MBY5040869.1 DNA-dependent RNA polymerase auxiliary subunit epsilon family protein [Streptococcus gallolyticus]
MIYKVFYQETKERSPRREQTLSLYLEVEAASELEGRIIARQLVEENTSYNIEFIELLSENHLEYEKTHADFKLTEF